jgi:tetratricopeptide (TPR) repeat protein
MVAATAATISLFGGIFAHGSGTGGAATQAAPPAPGIGARRGSASTGNTAEIVSALQARVRGNPRNVFALTQLALAYQQRARETGDPSYYPKSSGLLRRALALSPRSPLAISGLGSLALARHRFHEALVLGRRAVSAQPGEGRHWGVVGDALIELGRYDEAFRAFDRMATLDPGVSSYARISYARELLGHRQAAIDSMRLAVEAAGLEAEPSAWTRVQLGKLYWASGKVGAAGRQYGLALGAFPGYVYALDTLAQVEAARGRLEHAIRLEQRAVDTVPLPQFVGQLGDLYRAHGDLQLAREQYGLIDVIQKLFVANGVRVDLELALFYVDHGIRPGHALQLARAGYAQRPSIDGEDTLAWALARTGQCRAALAHSQRALRLGTQDALKFFHRGMIERCLGHAPAARTWFRRSLALNPHFSVLWAPLARREAR